MPVKALPAVPPDHAARVEALRLSINRTLATWRGEPFVIRELSFEGPHQLPPPLRDHLRRFLEGPIEIELELRPA